MEAYDEPCKSLSPLGYIEYVRPARTIYIYSQPAMELNRTP